MRSTTLLQRSAVALGSALLFSAAASAQPPSRLPVEPLVVQTAHGPVRFRVEIAADDASRERGLMFRKHLGEHEGMIFDFPDAREEWFWMKNTLIPLDMLFVGPDGRIISIAHDAKPLDETSIPSHGPAKAVIEIKGGLADRLGIAPGDQVHDPRVFPGG